ncbi:YbhB/YbcL family Raf kinase inhibitor-like protein [Actinophytocola glycyrrhizae]|uniref:YbhB/YbcL family Raf kinase inhibitor-like protein n=1 Tax=Actinophytocola glycyrrhizae TaxID=2044873 RepID=A0ABV9S4N5_9PSEU
MPDPGSHSYDINRTRLRAEYDDNGVPDQHADHAANAELQREHPPTRVGDPERAAGPKSQRPRAGAPPRDPQDVIHVRSSAFADHDLMPERFAHDNGNISPPLEWDGVPDGSAELALLCEDPDAPDGPFVHWFVTGIKPDVTAADEGEPPPTGAQETNGFGEQGWGGPQPPVGDEPHRYSFRVYAFDHLQRVPRDLPAADLRATLDDRATATGTLVGRFGR